MAQDNERLIQGQLPIPGLLPEPQGEVDTPLLRERPLANTHDAMDRRVIPTKPKTKNRNVTFDRDKRYEDGKRPKRHKPGKRDLGKRAHAWAQKLQVREINTALAQAEEEDRRARGGST